MEQLHKVSAGFVFAFLCLHFANHFIGLEGIDAHMQFMDAARLVYRHPVVELLVLLAFVIQAVTGLTLSKKIWRERKDFIHQFQAASGVYLIVFVALHLAWVGAGRLVYNLDTNFYYAAAGLMSPTWKYVFFPFYGLGIFALFLHMGCILYDVFKKTNKPVGYAMLTVTSAIGVAATWALLAMYSGHMYTVSLPETYANTFGRASLPEALPAGTDKADAPKPDDSKAADPAKN